MRKKNIDILEHIKTYGRQLVTVQVNSNKLSLKKCRLWQIH